MNKPRSRKKKERKKQNRKEKSEITDPQNDRGELKCAYFGASLTEMAASSPIAEIIVITIKQIISSHPQGK